MISSIDYSSATTVFDLPAMPGLFNRSMKPAAIKDALIAKQFSLHYHLVLHADRTSRIEEAWRVQFYKYIAGCLRAAGGEAEAIGGAGNHIHILFNVDSAVNLTDFVKRLKILTESWARRQKIAAGRFGWREDAQISTVSRSQKNQVRSSILNWRKSDGR